MKSKRMIQFCLTGVILFVLLSANALAFGVTAPYWPGNPMKVYPGETKEVKLTLQNMVGDEEVVLAMELKGDKKYVAHVDGVNVYTIPPKTKGVPVNFEVTVPEGTPGGTTFKLEAYFASGSQASSGQLALSTGITKGFDIIVMGEAPPPTPPVKEEQVVEPPKKAKVRPLTKDDLVPALIVLIIILIFWLLFQRSKIGKLKKRKKGMVNLQQDKHGPW